MANASGTLSPRKADIDALMPWKCSAAKCRTKQQLTFLAPVRLAEIDERLESLSIANNNHNDEDDDDEVLDSESLLFSSSTFKCKKCDSTLNSVVETPSSSADSDSITIRVTCECGHRWKEKK